MFDENGKFVMPCDACKRVGIERAAGPGFVSGMRGEPLWLCPDHGGRAYDYSYFQTVGGK